MTTNNENWYVIHTLSRKENVVYENLTKKYFNAYLPIVSKDFLRSGKVISSKRPLISNYVFVSTTKEKLPQLNFIVGSNRLLSNDGKPVTVTEKEMGWMKQLCCYDPIPQVVGRYQKGQKVKITSGILSGIEGEIVKFSKKTQIVICCGLPGYNFIVDIERESLEEVE